MKYCGHLSLLKKTQANVIRYYGCLSLLKNNSDYKIAEYQIENNRKKEFLK